MKITDIITTTEQPCVTLFRGIWLETIGFQKNVRKHIYEFRDLSCKRKRVGGVFIQGQRQSLHPPPLKRE